MMMLCITACSSLWNRANAGALQVDVATLFEQSGIQVSLRDCNMVGTTRTGYCRFRVSDGTADALIQDFNLAPVVFENATIAFIDAEFEAGCGLFPWILEGSNGQLYLISGRPQSISLPNGTSFEYLLLMFDASSGEACLQVSYAYG
jgi:hypothetical protein